MGFRENATAVVWKVYRKETKAGGEMINLNISTNRKGKDGNYKKDFSGFATVTGAARDKAETLVEGDIIKILSCEVCTNYVASTGKNYTNFYIYDYEVIKKSDKDKNANDTESAFDNFDNDYGSDIPF